MGEIRLSIGQVNILNWMLINVREVGAPGAVVASLAIPPPVPASQNVFFPGLNDVVHYVDIRSSSNGVSLGLLLSTFVYDAQTQQLIGEKRFYKCGGVGVTDPDPDQDELIDPYLDGKTIIGVFQEGFRFLVPDDYLYKEWEAIAGGGIKLLNGNLFQAEQIWSIDISYATASSPGTSSSSFPADIIEIPVDTILGPSRYNCLMEANASASILTITLPSYNTIPDRTKFAFNTDNGDQRYLKIVVPLPGYVQVDGVPRTILYMGKGEYLVLQKKGGYFRVLEWRGDHRRVGELVHQDRSPINGIAETGGWYDIEEYPRLFYWYVNELDPGLLGSGSYPDLPAGNNVRKWCIDLANDKFWVPDTGGYFDRNTDPDGNVDTNRPVGERKAGTTQADEVGPHWHMTGTQSQDDDPGIYRNGANHPVRNWNTGNTDNVGASSTASNTGVETRPKNINRNAYRII